MTAIDYTKLDHPKGASVGYRESSATWIARVYHENRYHTKSLGRVKDKREASRLAQEYAYSVRDGAARPMGDAKLQEVIDSYLAELRGNGNARGQNKSDQAKMRLDALVPEKLLSRKAAHVRLADVKKLQTSYSRRTNKAGELVSADSVNRVMAHLIAALNHGHRMELIPDDSGWKHYARLESPAVKRKVEPEVSIEDRLAFIEAAPAPLQAFVKACHYLGARPSEITRLRRDDVDLERGLVMVHTYKGKARTREIPLPVESDVRALFEARLAADSDVLFPTATGLEWTEANLCKAHKKVRDDLELPAAMTTYSWRHNRLTDWVRAGHPALEIAAFAGTSVQHLQDNYYKPSAEIRSAMASM